MNDQLLQLVHDAPVNRFTGQCGRAHRHDRNPWSGKGAALRGGRYNTRGIETLYLGQPPEVAEDEVRHYFARQELSIPPDTFVVHPIDVDFERVLDLTRAEVRDAVQFGLDELTADHHGRLPELGEAAHYLGFHAIVSPSARADGRNIAVFLTNAAGHLDIPGPPTFFV